MSDTRRLYKMEYTIDIVVYAEDANEAEEIAESAVRDEIENAHPFLGPEEVTERRQVVDWVGSLPYAKDRIVGELTVGAILDAQAEARATAEAAKDTKTIDMFPKEEPKP